MNNTCAIGLDLGGTNIKGLGTNSSGRVLAEIVSQHRADKVVAFKKRRRKNTHRKRGHRQQLTRIKINSISAG